MITPYAGASTYALALFALVSQLQLVSALLPPRESYAACMDTAPTDLQAQVSLTSVSGDCSNHCVMQSTPFRYAYTLADVCGCSNVGPTAAQFSMAQSSQMACSSTQWNALITLTTFDVPKCYTGFSPTSSAANRLGPHLVADHSECFRYCIDYDAASLIPSTSDATYQCICDTDSDDIDDSTPTTPCQRGALVRYAGHSAGQTTNVQPASPAGASVWVKRQLREQLRLKGQSQQKVRLCPRGLKACLVARGSESWECVDTDSELESCGGCLYGEYDGFSTSKAGIDCSAIPGTKMGGVTCTHGQCAVWACDPGYQMQGRDCVLAKKKW